MATPYKYDRGQKIKAEGGAVDMSFLAHVQLTAAEAVAADADGIAAITMKTTKQTITENLGDMPACRNLTVVGTAAGITGNLIVTGINAAGEEISETFVLNGTTPVVGSKAFMAVVKVEVPVRTAADDAVQIGWGVKFGIPYKLALDTVLAAYVDGDKESTAPTVIVSADALENNMISFDTTPAGKATEYFLIV